MSENNTRIIKYSKNVLSEADEESKVARTIIEIDEFLTKEILDDLFAELIVRKIYPLTKGIPLCNIDMQHSSEFFGWQESNDKPTQCTPCLFKARCSYNSNYKITPITDKEQHKDALRFITNESTISNL